MKTIATSGDAERAFLAINNMIYDLRSALFDTSLNEEQRKALFSVINAVSSVCKLSAAFLDELDHSIELRNILIENGIDVEFVSSDNNTHETH